MPVKKAKPKEESQTDVYENLGLIDEDSKSIGDQWTIDCPFCDGHEKLYISQTRAVFDCKVCGVKGNNYTIVHEMFTRVYQRALTSKMLVDMAVERHLSTNHFESAREFFGFSQEKNKVLFAIHDPDKGRVTGLRMLSHMNGKNRWLNFPGLKIGILGLDKPVPDTDTVYVCEGEWDLIATRHTLEHDLGMENATVVALPGVGTQQARAAELFQGKHVVCLFDNDEAGDKARNAWHRSKGSFRSLKFIWWPEGTKDGYDMNDLVSEKSSTEVWSYIQSHLTSDPVAKTEEVLDDDEQELPPEGSLPKLYETFGKWLSLVNYDLLDVTMGIMWSIRLDGDPLWLLIVAPPAGSKSETMMPISEYKDCYAFSTLTSAALVSGFNGGKEAGDPSLLGKIEGKRSVLMIKDLTPILQAPDIERNEIFGILRDAYDGKITKHFGNGLVREYSNLHFAVIAGVTPAIDMFSNVSMGERFVKFRPDFQTRRTDDLSRAMRAAMNSGNEVAMRKDLKDVCVAALSRRYDVAKCPKPDEDFIIFVTHLAFLCAHFRGAYDQDENGYAPVEAIVEVPTRLTKQLTKLAQGLAMHLEKDELTDSRILELVRRVALHTPDLLTMRIVRRLYYCLDGYAPKDFQSDEINSQTQLRILTRLQACGVCYGLPDPRKDNRRRYHLTQKIRNAIDICQAFDLPDGDILNHDLLPQE